MLVLLRDSYTESAVLGRLFLGCTCICYTLENRQKAIPCGTYNLENSKSPKFKRELPLIYGYKVAESRGLRIHAGNTAKDSAGCVLVGMGRDTVDGTLTESKLAETMVAMLCRSINHLCITEIG